MVALGGCGLRYKHPPWGPSPRQRQRAAGFVDAEDGADEAAALLVVARAPHGRHGPRRGPHSWTLGLIPAWRDRPKAVGCTGQFEREQQAGGRQLLRVGAEVALVDVERAFAVQLVQHVVV